MVVVLLVVRDVEAVLTWLEELPDVAATVVSVERTPAVELLPKDELVEGVDVGAVPFCPAEESTADPVEPSVTWVAPLAGPLAQPEAAAAPTSKRQRNTTSGVGRRR